MRKETAAKRLTKAFLGLIRGLEGLLSSPGSHDLLTIKEQSHYALHLSNHSSYLSRVDEEMLKK